MDWNDVRYFLAVAETGSTLAAGRRLHVSQTTAARRVTALEEALGVVLFDRRQAGYALTPAGEELIDTARAIEAAAGRFADVASRQQREAAGIVRLTCASIYATTILPAVLRDLHTAHPAIRIELDSSDALVDLADGGADIAIRLAKQMSGGGLVGRKIADDLWALYCSRDYADEHGVPHTRAELARHSIIGGGGDPVRAIYHAWIAALGLDHAITVEHSTATGLLAAVRAGAGLTVLPCLVGENDPTLVRCMAPDPGGGLSLWLLTHERLRHTPRVRVVLDFLGERLPMLDRTRHS